MSHMNEQQRLWAPEMAKRPKVSGQGASKRLAQERAEANVGVALPVPVPQFDDEERPAVCLERDFPITAINALAANETNAAKPVYQMSKWWARRRSAIFRATLLAAAMQAPDELEAAAKAVWYAYYANHQQAGNFRQLKLLDPFMGGGTTLIEGSRLGFAVHGVDLNPVAWFVVRNELACVPAPAVAAAFDEIERAVAPELAPFYATSCARGHLGRWRDRQTGEVVALEPLALSPAERQRYRWEGPEVLHTFWVKHGECGRSRCGHRTPLMRSQVVAEKALSVAYLELRCTACQQPFRVELGETRIAPGATHLILPSEMPVTFLSAPFAQELRAYQQGHQALRRLRPATLLAMAEQEPGLRCPHCQAFGGEELLQRFRRHQQVRRIDEIKKSDLQIRSSTLHLTLLVAPAWLNGCPASAAGEALGGYAGAPLAATARWYAARTQGLELIEVRWADGGAQPLPAQIPLGERLLLTDRRTVAEAGEYDCQGCGRPGNNLLDEQRKAGTTAPVAVYALQCFCPQCAQEGQPYGGRYFKAPDAQDIDRLLAAEAEWERRREADLAAYWPREAISFSHMTHQRNDLPGLGYTHWWKLFHPRQLLAHASLLRAIMALQAMGKPLALCEQLLGAFQQYLRNQNLFVFWHHKRDHIAPLLSNPHFHPKACIVENNLFGQAGYGNWRSCANGVVKGLQWCSEPWETAMTPGLATKSQKLYTQDPVRPGAQLHCGTSSNLAFWSDEFFDLIITDPPFGDNLFYADLADFFYVWLRIPLLRWYAGRPEAEYFISPACPRAAEAVANPAEHPDTRTSQERRQGVMAPADQFYQDTLTYCWVEARRLLKPGGLMAFTFHHSAHEPWVVVLEALFEAGFVLLKTYPIRSDESKGEGGAFGAKKIEYDILHVCRKRREQPLPIDWSRVRIDVRNDLITFRQALDSVHSDLSPDDLRVMLYGKALEVYSLHYGAVYLHGEPLSVRGALIGLEQILAEIDGALQPPPEGVDPWTGLFLSLFQSSGPIPRDNLHKRLRLRPASVDDLVLRGWVEESKRSITAVPILARFAFWRQKPRAQIRIDLDQAHFLIGAAMTVGVVNIREELARTSLALKPSVVAILQWYEASGYAVEIRQAAERARRMVQEWLREQQAGQRTADAAAPVQATLFDTREE